MKKKQKQKNTKDIARPGTHRLNLYSVDTVEIQGLFFCLLGGAKSGFSPSFPANLPNKTKHSPANRTFQLFLSSFISTLPSEKRNLTQKGKGKPLKLPAGRMPPVCAPRYNWHSGKTWPNSSKYMAYDENKVNNLNAVRLITLRP